MEKLSSGMRINRAGDDAAGLAISEKMRGQIRGLKQASRNAQDAISLIQTAEGALNETHAILQRMRELAVQSATDTNTDDDRAEIQAEIDQLATEITRIADTTEFNTMNLLGGGFSGIFHIGANDGQNLDLDIADMTAAALGVAGVGGGADGEDASYVHTSEEITGFDFSGNAATVTIGETTVTLDENYTDIDSLAAALDFSAEGVTVTVEENTLVFTGTEAFTIEVDGDGAAILAGVAGTAEAAEAGGTEAVAASGTTTVDGDEVTFVGGQSEAYNGIEIAFVTDTENKGVSAAFADGTITVTLSVSAGDDNVDQDAINNAIAGISEEAPEGVDWSNIQVDGNAEYTAAEWAAAQNVVLSGGAEAGEAGGAGGSGAGIDVSSQDAANSAIDTIDSAITIVSTERSKLGALQNRLEHTIANLGTSAENLQAAESRIRDLDMAEEIMAFTKNNILQQAATAMLAQANMAPQSVLQLLG